MPFQLCFVYHSLLALVCHGLEIILRNTESLLENTDYRRRGRKALVQVKNITSQVLITVIIRFKLNVDYYQGKIC